MNKDALCGPNMPINHFEVILNNKDIKAWGCIFYFLPKEFLDYLITIDLNPEIQNKHCKYVRHMKKIWRMIFPGKPESISI
jgi:hypothetical protein